MTGYHLHFRKFTRDNHSGEDEPPKFRDKGKRASVHGWNRTAWHTDGALDNDGTTTKGCSTCPEEGRLEHTTLQREMLSQFGGFFQLLTLS